MSDGDDELFIPRQPGALPPRSVIDELLEQAATDVNDLRLVVMSAIAFNLGFTQSRLVEPVERERLWDACERLGAVAGLEVDRTRGAA